MNTRENRLNEIKVLLCDILEIEEEAMTEVSLFKEEHNADSLRAIEILASLEKKYSIEIPQTELENMVSLGAVYDVVAKRAAWN